MSLQGQSPPVALTQTEVEAIAGAFFNARAAARPLDAFPVRLPETLADAVRVQERALAMTTRPIAGWKVAMIHPDLRPILGASRLAGPVFADSVQYLPAGGSVTVAVYDGGFGALEAEFVARLAIDLEPGPEGFTEAGILAALSGIHAGVEVASSPLATLNDLGPTAVVSDHGNNGGVVVGPEIAGWRDRPLSDQTSRMLVDGVIVGEGSAAKIPGGPVDAVRYLAEHLATRGRRLRAGDLISTGMTTGVHVVHPGSRGRIEFSGAAACDMIVAAAVPRP